MDGQVGWMAADEVMRLENYVLALAYAPGRRGKIAEPLAGRTALQKLLFHLRKGLQAPKSATEIPHFYGPFDEQAEVVAEQLEASGYLKNDEAHIALTPLGLDEAREVWETELTKREKDVITHLKAYFSDMTSDEILAVTYAKYPETAIESMVRAELEKRGRHLALSLLRRGKVSVDLAARIAGMPLPAFMKEASKHGIAVVESD
jgi:predicted HTH domain antitoxin